MRTIFSEQTSVARCENRTGYGGELVKPFERPSRADMVVEAVRTAKLGPVEACLNPFQWTPC